MEMKRLSQDTDITIASSGTQSEEVDIQEWAFGSVQFPSAFTGATVSIQGQCGDSGAWVAVHDSSGALSMTVTASTIQRIPDAVFGCTKIRFVSASSEAAERTLHVHLTG